MSDYISREAANKALCEFCGICTEPGDLKECEIVNNFSFPEIPAAAVRPVVRGEFVGKEKVTMCYIRECSNCHGQTPTSGTFCSVCGAYMRGEEAADA